MPSFYTDKDFLNTTYALDISLETHLSGQLFPDEVDTTDRVIYASNQYALRRRTEEQNLEGSATNLNLPFLNYHLNDFNFGQQSWWNNELFSRGVFIDEIGQKVKISPVLLAYEATFWCHRMDESLYAFTQLRFDSDSKTTITGQIDIGGITVPFSGQLGYTNLNFRPTYTEQDWLDKNNIHSITLDFEVQMYIMKADTNITIPEKVILEFNSLHGINNDEISEESVSAIIDHFNESVGEFT